MYLPIADDGYLVGVWFGRVNDPCGAPLAVSLHEAWLPRRRPKAIGLRDQHLSFEYGVALRRVEFGDVNVVAVYGDDVGELASSVQRPHGLAEGPSPDPCLAFGVRRLPLAATFLAALPRVVFIAPGAPQPAHGGGRVFVEPEWCDGADEPWPAAGHSVQRARPLPSGRLVVDEHDSRSTGDQIVELAPLDRPHHPVLTPLTFVRELSHLRCRRIRQAPP